MKTVVGRVALLYGLGLPLCCLAVNAYVPKVADPVLEPWRWREMEELGGQGILCMDEAGDGTLWFGCIGGVMRYDGLTAESIPFVEELADRIGYGENRDPWGLSVLCLQDDSLLVVAENGLVRWAGGEWHVVLRNAGTPSFATHLGHADDGAIWLLMGDAVWHLAGDLSTQDAVLRVAEGERLLSFCHDQRGDVWVVRNTPYGHSDLIHIPLQEGLPLEKSQWRTYRVAVASPGSEAAIGCGDDGRIWYVDNSAQNSEWTFHPRSGTWEEQKHLHSGKGYHSVTRDRSGKLWAGGAGKLCALRSSEIRYYSTSQLGLPITPLTICETDAGKWWIVGRGGHVYFMDPGDGQWLTHVGLHFECDAPDGREWFLNGSRRVVSHDSTTGAWLEYSPADGVIDRPRSLHTSSHGLIWALGDHGGRAAFSVFDGNTWTRHLHPDFASFIGTSAFLEAADATVWLGAMGDRLKSPPSEAGGALQYAVSGDGRIKLLRQHSSLVAPYTIARIAEMPDGIFWLGAPVVSRYDVQRGVVQAEPDLPAVHTCDMVVDGNDNLWVAKGLFGVYRREEDGWRSFSAGEGLAGSIVVDLLPLVDGTLLAATDTGISRFDGNNWAGHALGAEFGMSARSGGMRQSADGAVWFNFTRKDVRSPRVNMNVKDEDRFCTVRYAADELAPDTTITKHLHHVDSSGNIHITWMGRDPWGNTPANKLQYSWRIDHSEWSPFSYETGRTLLDLPSGEHTLEVRSRDRDLNVDPTPATSLFTVALPVWRRGWFIGMVLVIAGAAASLIRMPLYFHAKRLKERARHLEEVEQMKTGFFTNVSHELNTPLGLIRGPLERLMSREHDKEAGHLLDMAMRNVDRMSSLVSQILDFRKLEQGKVRMDPVEGDIAQRVRESFDLLQPAAMRKQVTCTLTCEDACVGWFDPEKLDRIVSNLVGNAIKYTQAGGGIVVTLGTVMEDGDPKLLLVVEDTGIGVASEDLPHIFDRFYRSPGRTSVDGSGIGLNLTKELVGIWGGLITAESPIHEDRERPGVRFTVRLPITRDQISTQGANHGH